jgi:hypothetical protein
MQAKERLAGLIEIEQVSSQYSLVKRKLNMVLTMYTIFELLLATYRDYQEIYNRQPMADKKGS